MLLWEIIGKDIYDRTRNIKKNVKRRTQRNQRKQKENLASFWRGDVFAPMYRTMQQSVK